MNGDITLLQPETLRSQVENALRDAIASGKLPPGSRLVERDLCEKLGVSRTSVREALRKLEAEKLVNHVPHKGPVVAVISQKEAADLYALRGLLEGYAARAFAKAASQEAVDAFGDAVAALRAEAANRSKEGVLRAKAALYGVLLDNCDNALIKEVLLSLYTRINLLRATSLMHPDRLPSSLQEIDALYVCLKERDEEGAERAARLHVANACEVALGMLLESASVAAV